MTKLVNACEDWVKECMERYNIRDDALNHAIDRLMDSVTAISSTHKERGYKIIETVVGDLKH